MLCASTRLNKHDQPGMQPSVRSERRFTVSEGSESRTVLKQVLSCHLVKGDDGMRAAATPHYEHQTVPVGPY